MTHWKDGKYDGTLEEYRKDGTKRLSRTYSNGEKHGKKVLYHLNGKEKITFFYEHGKLVADGNNSGKEEPKEQKIYYDNGNPSCYLTYNEAEQTFVFTLFYRTGGKAMEISKKQEDTHGEKYSLDGKARNMTNDEVKVFEFMSGFSGLMSFCELGNDIIGDFMNEKY